MASKLAPLGIKKIEALQYYVHDLDRVLRFLTEKLDFAEVGVSTSDLDHEGKQRSAVLRAGDATFVLCEPIGEGGRAWRFLRKHPEGVGAIVFEVEDIERCFALLDERGGTFISDIQRFKDDGGTLAMFNITTAFGDTTFRFVERCGYRTLFPGLAEYDQPRGGKNRFGLGQIDHVTANFQTLMPMILWMEQVMGFERFWEVKFHTRDVDPAGKTGSGLKSVVVWDPHSGVKFANNEPMRPFFKASQINVFGEDHRGDGIQHAALTVRDILGSVRGMREAGVEFMHTPGSYFDMLPERLRRIGVESIDEPIDALRKLEILVDGDKKHQYLLQIFLKESAGLFHAQEAGPFFFEVIQRKGDQGFGQGNFRALFESIERDQKAQGRI